MRYYIPQYIMDAIEEIKPYMEIGPDGLKKVRDDAPYYIKDADMALNRWFDWHDEVLRFGE